MIYPPMAASVSWSCGSLRMTYPLMAASVSWSCGSLRMTYLPIAASVLEAVAAWEWLTLRWQPQSLEAVAAWEWAVCDLLIINSNDSFVRRGYFLCRLKSSIYSMYWRIPMGDYCTCNLLIYMCAPTVAWTRSFSSSQRKIGLTCTVLECISRSCFALLNMLCLN